LRIGDFFAAASVNCCLLVESEPAAIPFLAGFDGTTIPDARPRIEWTTLAIASSGPSSPLDSEVMADFCLAGSTRTPASMEGNFRRVCAGEGPFVKEYDGEAIDWVPLEAPNPNTDVLLPSSIFGLRSDTADSGLELLSGLEPDGNPSSSPVNQSICGDLMIWDEGARI
jgi:hypothetical protein